MSQTSLQRCYSNCKAETSIFKLNLKCVMQTSMQLGLFWKYAYCLLLNAVSC